MAYADVVLADTPVGFWLLDEASGTVATDSSGNGNDGTYFNTPTLGISGPFADYTAVDFNQAQSEYVQIASAAVLHVCSGTDPWTVEMWFKGPSGVGDFNGPAFVTTVFDGTRVESTMGGWTGSALTNLPSVGYYNGAHRFVVGTTNLSDDTWHHLVGTFDGTELEIWVDATSENTSTPASAPSAAGTQDFRIMRRWDGSQFTNAKAFGVALYDYVLTPDQIAAHFAGGEEFIGWGILLS